ncbi:hypothetical protein PI126_g12743 [Phytophthora idaei]|nr:hypothetical protein PI126_g12743 [Phytophthora idaei]
MPVRFRATKFLLIRELFSPSAQMPRFKARWRELRREGWDSRHPTGLSNDYIYVMPGKTKKDKRGVDFFVGEKELMLYLDRVDLGKDAYLIAS